MAIYGDFEYHAFSDIIKVLQRHTGVLFMRTALQGRSVEMHLQQGMLHAVFIDGFPVNEPLRVRDTIRTLVNTAKGEYSFEAGGINQYMTVPVMDLIRDVLSTADIPEQQLPHQDTRFEWTSSNTAVPDSLRASWAAVSPILRQGSSATDIASQLRISLQEARVVLYRLRAAGLITPVRAAGLFQAPASTPAMATSGAAPMPAPASQPAAESNNPLRRMLSALRRFAGGR